MDSYPSEFLSSHIPLLFVAGLNPPPASSPALTTGPTALAASPSAAHSTSPPAPSSALTSTDQFDVLLAGLRKALISRKSWHIWDNSRGVNNDFHVIAVDKTVRFPPLKARPSSTSAGQPPAPLHSPISPLSPASPLYPDGIMAPIWIRKHREMIPAVFVLVLRLGEFDYSTSTAGPLDTTQKDDAEREQDAELVSEILDRKRSTVERGIKLAVVLLCSRRLLDDPALDNRLSLIRRQSGLDSRASLFVISPVPQSEINNFVLSLRAELYPSAMDYYREHGRRVRRKRARQVPKDGLSDKGWTVRYDYKMGLFSEMRGEVEVALKHYEDCYDTLAEMFPQTTLLQPRTKRWAEAKVLADCLSAKVSKLYLYLNESSRAVAQMNRHVARFRELSNTWGIGEQTFEFWSWLSKQYRLFGDLVAIGIRAGFRLPAPHLLATVRSSSSTAPDPAEAGIMPANVLQHPGYYFYMSASCATRRRDRYRDVTAKVASARTQEGQPMPVPPSLAHEMKVDHAEMIIELLTKAYEFFKVHKTKNMTFYVAAQIALAHFDSGNHDMALKFHDRISKNYRRDRWRTILDPILRMSVESATHTGDHETAIRCLVELMSPKSQISQEERTVYAKRLEELLNSASPASPEKARLSLDIEDPLLDCQVSFWQPTCDIDESVPFQLSISAPANSCSSFITFARLEIRFSDRASPVVITGSDDADVDLTTLGDLGNAAKALEPSVARLQWLPNSVRTFFGSVSSAQTTDVQIASVTLVAEIGAFTLAFNMLPQATNQWRSANGPLRLDHKGVSCRFQPRELRIGVDVKFDGPAYVGEAFEIHVDITNHDENAADISLDILLQPGEDDSPNQILVDGQQSAGFVKDVQLGKLEPSRQLRKTFRILCVGSAGDRSVDISIRSQLAHSGADSSTAVEGVSAAAGLSTTELLRTIVISAVRPFDHVFDAHFHHNRQPVKSLFDMTEPHGWEGASEVTLLARLHTAGPWDLDIDSLRLIHDQTSESRVLQSSLPSNDAAVKYHWKQGDVFNIAFRLEVAVSSGTHLPRGGSHLELRWRRHGCNSEASTTTIPLPSLEPIPLEPTVIASYPPTILLHQRFDISYRFSNPSHRLVRLSTQMESPVVPGSFVFAGPRKTPLITLAPGEEQTVKAAIIPLAVGACALPRMRVFMHDVGTRDDRAAEEAPVVVPAEPKVTELEVVGETDVVERKDPAQRELENELRRARGGDDVSDLNRGGALKQFVVLVLPR